MLNSIHRFYIYLFLYSVFSTFNIEKLLRPSTYNCNSFRYRPIYLCTKRRFFASVQGPVILFQRGASFVYEFKSQHACTCIIVQVCMCKCISVCVCVSECECIHGWLRV